MKHIYSKLTILLLLLLGSTSVFASSSKKTFYSKAVAHAKPTAVGKVWVGVSRDGENGKDSRGWSNPGTAETYDWTKVDAKSAPTYIYHYYKEDPQGYTFKGWYKNSDCTNLKTTDAEFTENVTATTNESTVNLEYWAYWTANTYTVNYYGNATATLGGSMSQQTLTYGGTTALNNIGFTNGYKVTFDEDGGSAVSDQVANSTFSGWATSSGGNVVYANQASFAEALKTNNGVVLNLYAKWGAIPAITLPAAPTKSGSQFEGWYKGDVSVPANKVGDAGDSYTPTANVTLTAKWVEKYDFTITGGNYTINNEDWNKTSAFTFTHADEANMTTTIQNPDVISYDRQSNTITAKKIGASKITFTQNTSTKVKNGSFEWTITVDSVANTLAVSETSFTNKYVGEEITSILSNKNSNGTISTTSSNPNLAYYDKDDNIIYIPNTDAQTLPFDDVTITISQAATAKYKAKKHVITLTVTKTEPIFTLDKSALELEQTATLSFENTSGASVVFSKDGVVSYNANTGIISAVAVGETKMTVTQQQTGSIAYKQQEFPITVSKKTPTLIVKMDGTAATSKSVTRGTTVAITFEENSDANVVVTPVKGKNFASYVNDTMTAGAVGTAKYSASLAETDTYQAKSVDFELKVTTGGKHLPYSNANGFTVGSGSGTDWTNKYVQIDFKGIPDKLSFDFAYDYDLGLKIGNPTLSYDQLSSWAQWFVGSVADSKRGHGNTHMLYVEESADGNSWSTIWTDDDASNKDTRHSGDISLKKTTRYVRFHHSCNYSNSYTSISVSELKYVDDPAPTSIDFGEAVINSKTKTQTATVNWCNVAPMSVTSSNPRISVTPASFGNFDASGTQTITLSYTPASTDETVNAEITLSNGDNTYDKTIQVTAATVRRPQSITWNADLKATGYAMNVGEQYPDANMPIIATATNNGRITFTTADATKIEVIADTALRAKAVVNKIKIAAHQAGDAEYQAVHDTVEFTVTNLQKQSITWNQNLRGLLTTSDTVHLKARASSGMKITYTSGNTNVVKITNDSVLEVVGEGKTYITATQAGGKDKNDVEWLSVSQDNYVIVRNPNAQCEEVAVSISEITLNQNNLYSQEYPLSGIPEKLTFTAKHGEKSASIWGAASYSSLIVEEYAVRNNILDWYELFNDVVGTSFANYTTFKSKEMILDETATKIRVRTLETGTDHTVTKILVTRKMFARADVDGIDAEVEADAIWSQDITVTHSNIDVMTIRSKKNILSFSSTTLGAGCGDFGNHSFTASFTPSKKNTHYYDTIVITDGKASETHTIEIPVHLYSTGLTQAINDFNVPATALSTDANITLSATASSEETVKFATSDTTKARIVNGNELEIVAAGTVKVYAMQAGNAKYDSVAVEKTLVISKVTPVIAENEKPAAENVRYNGTWDNSLLTGGVARVTWRGVADTEVAGQFVWSENVDETITNIPNTYNRSVTFKPKDSGKFNEVTFTMPVNVQRAVSSIAVDNKTIIVSLPEESVNFDLSTLVSEHIGGGNVTFDFIDEVTTATINGVTFTPSAYDEYAIRATIAQTEYYTSETADFTVSVIEGILFDGTNTESLTADDPIIINSNVTIGYGESVEVKALTINCGNTLTIANGGKLTVGADNSFNRDVYGNIVIEAGGKLILNEGEVHLNEFTLQSTFESEKPMSGQVFNQNKLIMHGDAYFIMDIDPSGETSYGWYKFSVPFPVDELRGITRWENNDWKPLTNEVNYAVMKYHENLRAQGKYGWKKYTGILQPGEGYSITTDTTINRYRFKKADTAAFDTCKTYNLIASEQGIETDLGWNSLGNRTMEYVSLKNAPGAVVQVYDHNTNEYHSEDATLCSFVVGAAYFVQAIENNSSFRLNPAEDNQTMLRAPQRVAEENDECRISLSLMANGHKKDMLIVTCDDQAQATYTRGKDVQKMGATTGAKAARIWVNAKGTNLCAYNTAFSSNDQAIIPLNIYAPTQGEYTLKLNYQPAEEVYLRRNGIIVWNMEMGDYFADFAAGTDNSYDLLVIRHAPNTATGIDAIDSENDKNGTIFVEKIIVNDQLYILRDGTLYDAQGRVVTNR